MNPSDAVRLLPFIAALLASATAHAQPSMPALTWRAPAGCPQAQAVRDHIVAMVSSGTERATRLQADGEITQIDGRFRLKLKVREGELTGERYIVSDSCEDLAGAAAVALGLLLRADAPLTERDLGGAQSPSAEGSAGAPPSTDPASDANDRAPAGSNLKPSATSEPERARVETSRPVRSEQGPAQTWQALVRLPTVVVDLGLLPQPSLGLALGGGAGYGEWRFLLVGQLWLNQTVPGRNLPTYSAEVARQTAALGVSRGFHLGRLGLGPSASLTVERISAQGIGSGVVASKQSVSWLSLGAGVFGSLRLGKNFAVVTEIAGRLETSRPLITIDGLGTLSQLGRAALAISAGGEWNL